MSLFVFQEIPTDKSGDFEMIYAFLKAHWDIVRWVALGAVVFEVTEVSKILSGSLQFRHILVEFLFLLWNYDYILQSTEGRLLWHDRLFSRGWNYIFKFFLIPM